MATRRRYDAPRATAAHRSGAGTQERAESLEDSARSTRIARAIATTGLPLAPTEVLAREGIATASSDNRIASHSTDPHQGDRRPSLVLPQSIAAGAAEARPQRAEITGAPPTDRTGCPAKLHGTRWARYAHDCSCADAELATYRYLKHYRAGLAPSGLIDATGSRRRLQALTAIGYSAIQLGPLTGCARPTIDRVRAGHIKHVQRHVAARIARAYDELRGVAAPAGAKGSATRAVQHAEQRGWARPEHWDGVDIDDPAAVSDLAYQRTDVGPAGADAVWLASPAGGSLDHDQIAARLDTTAEHVALMLRHAAISAGSSGLTDDDIYDIRARWVAEFATGRLDRRRLAADYGISPSLLSNIAAGRCRPHLRLTDLIDDSAYAQPAARHPRASLGRVARRPVPTAERERPIIVRMDQRADGAAQRGEHPTLARPDAQPSSPRRRSA